MTENIPEVNFDFLKSPEQDISDKEIQEKIYLIIKDCVNNLTSKQQEFIYLRFESGISHEKMHEISGVLKINSVVEKSLLLGLLLSETNQ